MPTDLQRRAAELKAKLQRIADGTQAPDAPKFVPPPAMDDDRDDKPDGD